MHGFDQQEWEAADIMRGLYGDGIIGLKGAFDRDWVLTMREDIALLFEEARQVPGGALPRGPERFYVEVHPERIRGFVDIVMHPWFVAVCKAVLGPDYKIVEVGFDIPFPGAQDKPWHRDFPAPAATVVGRRLNSLAFNLTAAGLLTAATALPGAVAMAASFAGMFVGQAVRTRMPRQRAKATSAPAVASA